jgi:nucleoside-diphosphate-sugar epimerase
MKILITGALGGIGSMLVEHFKDKDLYLVDNYRNNFINEVNNVKNIDIRSQEFFNYVLDVKPDVLIHLAAITSLPECEINKTECIDVNVTGTVNVLEACKTVGVQNIIFASTSAIYENNDATQNAFFEDLSTSPRLFYSLSKKMAEEACISYRENYDLNVCILRFFNVVGPNQDILRKSPPLLNYLVREFINNRIPKVHSDGKQSRDYITVFDLNNLFSEIVKLEKFPKDTFNVASSKTISVNEMISLVKDQVKTNLDVEYRNAEKLWDGYDSLWSGFFPLKRSIVAKETNKFSLGSNLKITNSFDWKPLENQHDQIRKIIDLIINNLKKDS